MTQRPDPRRHASIPAPRLNGSMRHRITSCHHIGASSRLEDNHHARAVTNHDTDRALYSIAKIEITAGDAP